VRTGFWLAADRHEVGHREATRIGAKFGAHDVRVVEIRSLRCEFSSRLQAEKSAFLIVEQTAENWVGIEALETAPIDAAVGRHQRAAVTIADRRVIADRSIAAFAVIHYRVRPNRGSSRHPRRRRGLSICKSI